jgi:hypothetical protein
MASYDGQDHPMYPDFLFFRRQGEGVVVDILEPHSLHQDDSAAKAKGLADFALRHGDEFGRIELIVKEKDKLLRLDLNHGDVRDNVRAVSSNEHSASSSRTHLMHTLAWSKAASVVHDVVQAGGGRGRKAAFAEGGEVIDMRASVPSGGRRR